jgi:PAS domain S-box-containing protein
MKDPGELTILFVDDELDILSSLKRFLRREPYSRLFAESGLKALELLEENNVAVIVSDLRMPEMNGLELISEVKKRNPDTMRLILSGTQDFDQIIGSINKGEVFRFIPKPVDPDALRNVLGDAIDYYRLKTERQELFEELSIKNRELLGANDALRLMAEDLQRSEEKFRSMTDAAQDPVFMTNSDGQIVYRNNAAESIFGFSRSDYPGQRFMEIVAPEFREIDFFDNVEPMRGNPAGNGNGRVWQIGGLRKNGSIVPLEVSKGSVHIDSVPHTVLIARDISARVEAERSRERYETMQRELESEIEKKLLQSPFPSTLQGVSTGRMMLPSGHLDGDFMDYIIYDPRHADILIGDVMGHGIQSALIGAGLKSLFLKVVAQYKYSDGMFPPLSGIVRGMHDLCIRELIELDSFATLLFLRLDLESGCCTMVDCGHPPVLHYRASEGKCLMMKGENLPMGMIGEQEYTPVSFTVETGDTLVLFSDGITESSSRDNEMFGDEKLAALVETNHMLEPADFLETLKAALSSFSEQDAFKDDATCIVIRIDKLGMKEPASANSSCSPHMIA